MPSVSLVTETLRVSAQGELNNWNRCDDATY